MFSHEETSPHPEFACRKCGKSKDQWVDHGYRDGERHYCCKGCATGFWCLCRAPAELPVAIDTPTYSGPERRMLPSRRAWKQERRAMFLKN
jgi:hypothetical protein